MRIVAGRLGSRIFNAPHGNTTHPMSERVRGALFNSLGDITDKTILDAYAGSGALSFEALSRGAKSAVAIEKDVHTYKTLTQNIKLLGLNDQIKAIRANVSGWSDLNENAKFDLIFCDPPYDLLDIAHLEKIIHHLKANALMILSYSGRGQAPPVNGVVVVDNRSYGDAALATYRLIKK
jgi:16S rRNA (guanine(966)-N(2))-methyltransferase RsmD